MKELLLLWVGLSYPAVCLAAEPWDRTDIALGLTSTAALVVDWGQTRYIAKHPKQCSETNPYLGEHPSIGRVDAYFTGVIVGNLLLGNWLTPDKRKLLFGAVIVTELLVIGKNRAVGIKVEF